MGQKIVVYVIAFAVSVCFLIVSPVFGEDSLQVQKSTMKLQMPSDEEMNRKAKNALTLSAVLPGAGQFYTGHPFKGGTFLAFEAITGGVALFWRAEEHNRTEEVERFRDSMSFYQDAALQLQGDEYDSVMSRAGNFSIYRDRAQYEARQARLTSHNAMAWMLGGYVFNLMDAAGESGLWVESGPRDPQKAGWLAAIPGLGLGQLYNGSPSKAGMVIMSQISLGVMSLNHHRLMTDAQNRYNQMRDSTSAQYDHRLEHLGYWKSRYDQAFSRRNTYLWYSLFFYLYSIFDAVVDAHLSDYEEKMGLAPDLAVGMNEAMFRITFKL
ncbi:MAG: DUF5683 domain-containing protein [Chitinispirillaceae bacterium]